MDNQRFKTLAKKYLDGTAAPEEKQELMRYYELLQKRYPRWDTGAMGDKDVLEKELWNDINHQTGRYGGHRNLIRMLKIAASVVILIGAGFAIWQYRYGILNYVDPVKELAVATAAEELKELRLADGSRIWLNAGSELRYPSTFRDSLRVVRLRGEAYFEVAPDVERPFVIRSGGLSTRVLGTTFNVTAYGGEEKATVTVLSGKVAVGDTASGRKSVLMPKQQLTYDKTEQTFTTTEVTDPGNVIAWREGKLAFAGTAMAEVITTLQRWYDVTITFDEELASCPVFADFSDESLAQALEILAASFRGETARRKEVYHISGRECD